MKVVQMTPEAFVKAVLTGRNNEAYRTLYDDPKIIRTIAVFARDANLQKAEPSDILQEAMLALDANIRKGVFKGESSVSSYLLSICRNMVLNNVRTPSKVVHKGAITENECPDVETMSTHLEVQEQSSLEAARDAELRKTMDESLRDNCRDVLKRYYFERQSAAQIAEARKLSSLDMAKKAMFRCRQYLREALKSNAAFQDILSQLS